MRYFLFSSIMLASCTLSQAQAAEIDIWQGVFNQEQVEQGQELYMKHCAVCHGQELVADDPEYPALTQPAFRWSWQGRTLEERFQRISTTMPPATAGELSDQEYVDIIAYILNFNEYPTGEEHLTYDKEKFEATTITAAP